MPRMACWRMLVGAEPDSSSNPHSPSVVQPANLNPNYYVTHKHDPASKTHLCHAIRKLLKSRQKVSQSVVMQLLDVDMMFREKGYLLGL